MSKFAGIQVGLMQLRHIDVRLTVTAQIVELNPFHVCTTHSQCSVTFSTELLFCKEQIFFQLIAMVPLSMCFSLVQDKDHVLSLSGILTGSIMIKRLLDTAWEHAKKDIPNRDTKQRRPSAQKTQKPYCSWRSLTRYLPTHLPTYPPTNHSSRIRLYRFT